VSFTSPCQPGHQRRRQLREGEPTFASSSCGGGDNGDGEDITLLGDIQVVFPDRAKARLWLASWEWSWGPLQWYALSLIAAVGALTMSIATYGMSFGASPWVVAALAGVAFLAERQSVHIAVHLQMSVSALPILFAAIAFGPYPAMLVAAAALLTDFGRPYTRWTIWTFSRALGAGLAGTTAALLLGPHASFGRLLLAVAAAAVVEALTDILLTALTLIFRRNGSLADTWTAMSRLLLCTVPLYTPVIAALVYSYTELSPWTVLLFFVPALAAQRLLIMYQEQVRLVADLGAANQRLEKASLSFASALVAALDARDQYTAGHSAAVAVYARDIASRLDLSDEEKQLVHLAGLVHDIGKVGLPPGLLEKPGPLTLEERRVMEEHPAIGERILAKVEDYREIAEIVRHHHERVDGQGYPDGLRGDEIPLVSRIIAVADAYNAMTSGRPYRDAMPSRVARMRLAQAVGTQFDTTVAAAFEAILATANESYLSGAHADFSVEAQRQPALLADDLKTIAASQALCRPAVSNA
jgi:putative nucleotidyltransferase with HDIG domain